MGARRRKPAECGSFRRGGGLTLAGEAEGALESLQARDCLLGVALAEAVVGEEAGIVLDRAVQLVTAHCVRETEEEVASV